jgi:hypothetical protein
MAYLWGIQCSHFETVKAKLDRTAFKSIEPWLNCQYAQDLMGSLNTSRQVQRFKALKRKELRRKHDKGRIKLANFTLAAANQIKRQSLDVSRVEILEHEISPDT